MLPSFLWGRLGHIDPSQSWKSTDCWPFVRLTTSLEKAAMTATVRKRSQKNRTMIRKGHLSPESPRHQRLTENNLLDHPHPARGVLQATVVPGEGGRGRGTSLNTGPEVPGTDQCVIALVCILLWIMMCQMCPCHRQQS